MTYPMILAPLFVQVVLTLFVAFYLGSQRVRLGLRGEMPDNVTLREPNWPPRVRQIENNLLNQFETPVLFYVLVILAIITRHADNIFVMLSWIYVVLRLLHAYIHLTSNDLRIRGPIFICSVIILAIMWGMFILAIMLGIP